MTTKTATQQQGRVQNWKRETVSLGSVPADHLVELLEELLRHLDLRVTRTSYDIPPEGRHYGQTVVAYGIDSQPKDDR
jgi:hypothetical protein